MARYATGTATENQTQRDSNPVQTSTFQQVAGMHLLTTKAIRLPLLVYVLKLRAFLARH